VKANRNNPAIVIKTQDKLCNICCELKALTRDHVPPKSALERKNVEIESFGERLANHTGRVSFSQSGIRFQTICADCNAMLGRDCDPEFSKFCSEIREWLRSPLLLGDQWSVWLDARAVVRSVFGHMLAARSIVPDTVHDRVMRDFVLGKRSDFVPELRVFYWIHDHPTTSILSSFLMPAVRGNFRHFGIFSVLKAPPLGFMVTDVDSYDSLPELLTPKRVGKSLRRVQISKRHGREHDWPEKLDKGNIMMTGSSLDDGRIGRPRKGKS
jgi:hypothetical protein